MYRVCISFLIIFFSVKSISAPVEGQHYVRLQDQIRHKHEIMQLLSESPGKPQVIIFFSYACYWCGVLTKPFIEWSEKRGAEVDTYRYPIIFNKAWENLGKFYYALEMLSLSGIEHEHAIFDAIHKEGKMLWLQPEMIKFMEKRGVGKDTFNQAYTSFNVDRRLKKAAEITNAYEIVETPNIVVNNKSCSYLTNLAMTGDIDEMFAVVEYLLAKKS